MNTNNTKNPVHKSGKNGNSFTTNQDAAKTDGHPVDKNIPSRENRDLPHERKEPVKENPANKMGPNEKESRPGDEGDGKKDH